MSRDPEKGDQFYPETLHRYLYASEDPVNFADPSGRVATTAPYPGGLPNPLPAMVRTVVVYALIVGLVALPSRPSLAQIGCDVRAMLSATFLSWQGGFVTWSTFSCLAAVAQSPNIPIAPLIYPTIAGTAPGPNGQCQNPGDEYHHMLPQEFSPFFSGKLNIDDPRVTRCIPKNCHRLKSGNGLHTNQDGPGSNYNALWKQFFKDNPGASAQQILDELATLAGQFANQLICK